ncbi:thiol reductant ABC exporter subunit CydD [Mobiluncus mulieris]|uniref:Thiol reductant ABC exporter subunit CydD n=1 Tax=Mobiluncus mulieris TaxID=2052 RepID=A0A7Y0U0F4_9ACTO|nr:thiol reductant ABC exporter subunit CydD [Mobiluncus mulieris]
MKPLDPRLMKYAKNARGYIIFITVLGFLSAALIIGQDLLIANAASAVISHHVGFEVITPTLLGLLGVLIARATTLLIRQWFGHRAASDAIQELRGKVLTHATKLGPRWQTQHAQDTVTTVVQALKDLDAYFVFFLPQLLLSATVTPATLLVILILDWPSAIATGITIPLIPLFMILIGKLTQEYADKRLASMKRMGGQLVDLLAGLATLKALGREKEPARQVKSVGYEYTRSTMATLRVAFMSGGVLEFLTTLCVAIVAVEVGWRMLGGQLNLFTGLVVIMLAPEVFEPLRQVGKQFHASSDGVTAAEAAFTILEVPLPETGTQAAPNLETATLNLKDVGVKARGMWAPASLNALIEPGKIYALSGPSGAGKTTTAMSLLALQTLDSGTITVQDATGSQTDLRDIDPASWWKQCAWVPQNPAILPGTVLENLGESGTNPSPQLMKAAQTTKFAEVVESLSAGWHTKLGAGGVGLSVGQRQRLALTRALVNTAQFIVLDEPTAHLDANLETLVIEGIRALKASGKTVVVIAHRQAVLNLADEIIPVTTREFTPAEKEAQILAEQAAKPKPRPRRRKPDGREDLPPLILNLDFADAEVSA